MYKLLNDPYTNQETDTIKRLFDGAFIPKNEANTDYQAFLKYQAEGGKVYGADEEIPDGQATQ